MTNAWFRMYSEFATDPKVQSMSEPMQRRLMMLLCLRCSNALATLQDNEIAFALRISDEELAETKALFIQKKFIDEVWGIWNWDKRQYRSDSSTERSRKHRNKIATAMQRPCNVAATAPDTEQIQNRTDITTLPGDAVSPFQEIYDAGCAVCPALATANTSAIHAWIAAGVDPTLDAIPEIKRLAAAGKNIRSWSYFTSAVMDAHATRTNPLPEGKSHGASQNRGKRTVFDKFVEGTNRAMPARPTG